MSNTYDVGNIAGSDSMNSKESEFFEKYGNAIERQADLIARQHGLEGEKQEKTLDVLLRDLEGRKNEYVVQGALLHCSKGTCNRQTLMYKGKELESRPLQREAYTRIQVPEDREARINELIPARVDDCKGGLRDIRDGEANIHGFGNCGDIIGKVALEDLLARAELADREAEVREAIEAGKGTCHCLMKLNESWENLSLVGEYLTGYFDISPDLIEYERDRCSPSYLRFNGKEGINMMSMLFCSFGGGIITAQESGQTHQIRYTYEDIADSVTVNRIKELHPAIRQQVINFIVSLQQLYPDIRIAQGFRTIEQQDELYRQGRDGKGGNIITYAKGGTSYHNYGLAIDIVRIVDNQANYDFDWEKVEDIGNEYGFEWGGNWTSLQDKPHFQITFGYTTGELYKLYKENKVDEGFVILEEK